MRVPKNISRVHFIYLIIVFIIIIGFVSSLVLYNNEHVVNIISVSSGIISIIIGMLAIFIAVYQGLTQGTSIQKINESAERVDDVTKKLNHIDFIKFDSKLDSIEDLISLGLQDDNSIELKDEEEIKFDKDAYKRIFLRSENEILFGYYIERAYLNKKEVRLGELATILVKEKGLNQNPNRKVVYTMIFTQYVNFLRRSKALVYKKSKDNLGFYVKDLDSEYIEAINERKSTIKDSILETLENSF